MTSPEDGFRWRVEEEMGLLGASRQVHESVLRRETPSTTGELCFPFGRATTHPPSLPLCVVPQEGGRLPDPAIRIQLFTPIQDPPSPTSYESPLEHPIRLNFQKVLFSYQLGQERSNRKQAKVMKRRKNISELQHSAGRDSLRNRCCVPASVRESFQASRSPADSR